MAKRVKPSSPDYMPCFASDANEVHVRKIRGEKTSKIRRVLGVGSLVGREGGRGRLGSAQHIPCGRHRRDCARA